MDLRLKEECMEYQSCVLNRTIEDVFTSDFVVPDTLDDVDEVLLMDGDFCLWRLDLSSGLAEAEGEWKGTVCYRAEGTGSVQSFPVSVGIRMRMHDDVIEPNLKPYAVCRICEHNAQIMNSRKLRLKVRFSFALQGFAIQSAQLLQAPESQMEDVFFKSESVSFSEVSEVSEQIFTAGAVHDLRETPDDLGILSAHSDICFDPPKQTGPRSILNGEIQTTVLYLSKESGHPVVETIATPFSQLMDMNGKDCDSLRCHLQLTSFEYHLTDAQLETDFHIVMQMLSLSQRELRVVTDAYSINSDLSITKEMLELQKREHAESLQVVPECEITDMPDGAGILFARSEFSSMRIQPNGVSGSLANHLLYRMADGTMASGQEKTDFAFEMPDHTVMTSIRVDSPKITLSNDSVHIAIPVIAESESVQDLRISQIRQIERLSDAASQKDLPSVTLIMRSHADDLWECAKQFRSSTEAIEQANTDYEGKGNGRYLIVPRVCP